MRSLIVRNYLSSEGCNGGVNNEATAHPTPYMGSVACMPHVVL